MPQIKNQIQEIKTRYKEFFKEKYLAASTLFSFVILTAFLYLNYLIGLYVARKESNSVTDIVLSNTRVYDVDTYFVFGIVLFVLFIIIFSLLYPKKINYLIKSLSLFIFIRSVFVSLTHLGPFPDRSSMDGMFSDFIVGKFSFGADLFFSGHTGIPFLMALIFWKNKILRYTFIFLSVFFGVIVLLGHIHYSIDVLAAFFITYTIWHISEKLFKKELEYFNNN
jgi:membrane-associated phospholipid phosphatase